MRGDWCLVYLVFTRASIILGPGACFAIGYYFVCHFSLFREVVLVVVLASRSISGISLLSSTGTISVTLFLQCQNFVAGNARPNCLGSSQVCVNRNVLRFVDSRFPPFSLCIGVRIRHCKG